VLDFGLAKMSEKQMGRGSMMFTQQGMVFGTPEFMSPEQAQGEALDQRSDIYSLALILYELITGKLPFDAKTPLDMMKAHVRDQPIALSQRVPDKAFWPELDAVIAKALAKSPDERYASAELFGEALRACIRTPTTPPSQPSLSPVGSASESGGGTSEARGDASSIVVPVSRVPSLVLGLLIGVGVATAGYFALLFLGK
jgi:serine/threonine-protein kinase